MPKENKTRYALLGLLQQESMSGYDLKKLCDRSIGRYWNENYSNIYPVLKAMKIEGLVTMEIQEQDKSPNKKVYTITDLGLQTLKDWLHRQPENRHLREELLLQVGFGFLVDKEVVLDKLRKRKAFCEETLERLKETTRYLEDDIKRNQENTIIHNNYMNYTLSFGLKFYQMEIDWCTEIIENLEKFEINNSD